MHKGHQVHLLIVSDFYIVIVNKQDTSSAVTELALSASKCPKSAPIVHGSIIVQKQCDLYCMCFICTLDPPYKQRYIQTIHHVSCILAF